MKNVSIKRIFITVLTIVSIISVLVILIKKSNIPILPNSYCSGFKYHGGIIIPGGNPVCPLGCVVKHFEYPKHESPPMLGEDKCIGR